MNALRQPPCHESDDALDRAIHAIAAQPAPPDVKKRVLETAVAFTPRAGGRVQSLRRHSWRLAASAAAAIVAASLLALLMLPSASVGWADVTKAIQSQRWIRIAGIHKRDGLNWKSVMWISPKLQIWAFHSDQTDKTGDWFIFFDGRRRENFEYRTSDRQIVKMLLSDEDAQRFQPVDHMSEGSWMLGTERLVAKNMRDVTEDGKKWIDFDVVFFRGDCDLNTLRVDPATRLPVYLLSRSSENPTESYKFTFGYPADGPTDIYALGVPAKITIDDRMPSRDCQQVLLGMAASRAKIADFRLEVVVDDRYHSASSIVWRKGDRWRIDRCEQEVLLTLHDPSAPSVRGARPPDGLGWQEPAARKLRLSWVGANLLCNGRLVYVNKGLRTPKVTNTNWEIAPARLTPQELLSGEGRGHLDLAFYAKFASLVYPDLSPKAGWGFEFDPKPTDAPGCVLIKRSAQVASEKPRVGHEWYYIDPAKGCAVVRVEAFTLPANVPANPEASSRRQSIRMEDFRQSPQGFWYPQLIRDAMPLSSDAGEEVGPRSRRSATTVHYHFDFDVPIPDSLFSVDTAGKPK
jgi:hypothetical protein